MPGADAFFDLAYTSHPFSQLPSVDLGPGLVGAIHGWNWAPLIKMLFCSDWLNIFVDFGQHEFDPV